MSLSQLVSLVRKSPSLANVFFNSTTAPLGENPYLEIGLNTHEEFSLNYWA